MNQPPASLPHNPIQKVDQHLHEPMPPPHHSNNRSITKWLEVVFVWSLIDTKMGGRRWVYGLVYKYKETNKSIIGTYGH